ncbi:MAG: hypothetical protein ABIH89_09990 [Elusimicrobiota bacterium]
MKELTEKIIIQSLIICIFLIFTGCDNNPDINKEDDSSPSWTEVKSGTCPVYKPGTECYYEGKDNEDIAGRYGVKNDTAGIDGIHFSTDTINEDNYDGNILNDDWK